MSTGRLTGKGWTANLTGGQWVLRYYFGKARPKHRVPAQFTTVEDAKAYISAFLKEKFLEHKGRDEKPITPDGKIGPRITIQDFGELWTDGTLHKMFPVRIKFKKSAKSDKSRLDTHVYPVIGDIQVRAFKGEQGIEWAEDMLNRLESSEQGTHRHVAQVLFTLLNLAALPGIRLIKHNPLPRGFVPPPAKKKDRAYMYPKEEEAFLKNTKVPLCFRMFLGFSDREGGRVGNFLKLRYDQLDLENGIITLSKTKTDVAMSWALGADTTEALKRYQELMGRKSGYVFLDSDKRLRFDGIVIDPNKLSVHLRRYLKDSGVSRKELFAKTATNLALRLHDTRSTFVTVNLANGKSETWVADRTGHTTSQMLNSYRRKARKHEEACLGTFVPLQLAIPELRRPEDDADH